MLIDERFPVGDNRREMEVSLDPSVLAPRKRLAGKGQRSHMFEVRSGTQGRDF